MEFFLNFKQKINQWRNGPGSSFKVIGPSAEQWSYIFDTVLKDEWKDQHHFFLLPSIEAAEEFYDHLSSRDLTHQVLFFPGLEHSPYSGILSSEHSLLKRFYALDKISQYQDTKKFIVVMTWEALTLKIPPREFFQENRFKIELSDIISPYDLAKKLVDLGYSSSTSVEEPGSFCQKGEIFDIYPMASDPIRLHYFDDMIEEIFPIDLNNQRTVKTTPLEIVDIGPTQTIFCQPPFSTNLRSNIPMPGVAQKERFERRKWILNHLSNNTLFEGYPTFTPLFFENAQTIINYFDVPPISHLIESDKIKSEAVEFFEQLRFEYDAEELVKDSDQILPAPQYFFDSELLYEIIENHGLLIDRLQINLDFEEDIKNTVHLTLEPSSTYLKKFINPTIPKHEFLKEVFDLFKNEFKYSGDIVFCNNQETTKKELEHLIELFEIPGDIKRRIHFYNFPLRNGFFYETDKLLVLGDGDLFSYKTQKTKASKRIDYDLFADQLATLKEGDYVIHNEHGLGEYLGLQSMDIGSSESDFLIIQYANKDKIYVPVYKMNLIQKHADSSSNLKPDNLRTNKFSNLKAKARNSIKKLAFDLLKLQAKRQSAEAYAFAPPDHLFREFELAFPFQETPDQLQAVEHVLEDMQKKRPMDHLVCGDVGFGKTEVAMRAAFKAVEDGKQVAILVPTTVLALQHYNSFKKRFDKFAVNIDFLSRFKSTSEAKKVIESLALGDVDIVIGTHKLLSDTIKFKDLGLVIVDEEQRFGVGHKEKLKLLKASVDFLTLTATPIPRTLQMAFLGLRDLSLIQTAPPKRQSIKSYIIKEDSLTLQNAIKKELGRGGQVFIVHNRVNDIELYASKIQELVPEAKIVICHGQLPEKEIEKRMSAFYQAQYDILLATTIIESGLDIPNANTMIIDKANNYGLAQLHQLRGRIGRSDKKAYAYFVVPATSNLTPLAERRLKALQTYAEIGSGFNIASSDLEIRGAGDILGGEQSGHIEAIGLELYMELLKEEIHELKGETLLTKKDIEISTPFSAFIPNTYIKDSGERLKQYKRLSNIQDPDKLLEKREELQDIYGLLPKELENLFLILEARTYFQRMGLSHVQAGGKSINLRFDKEIFEANEVLRNRVIDFFMAHPKLYQFTPEYLVICNLKKPIDEVGFLEFSKDIAEKILPC